MDHVKALLLDAEERNNLWTAVAAKIEAYLTGIEAAPAAGKLDPDAIRESLRPFDFGQRLDPLAAMDFVVDGLWRHQVHTPHPRYFGLFNPSPTAMGIAADALTATFNPQMAAWSHSSFAVEVEQHLVRAFAVKFGYDAAHADGTFASGGAEANHTGMLCALVHAFPAFAREGLRALEAQPVFYISADGHHSFVKAARSCGLGTDAVRQVPTDENLKMDIGRLKSQIRHDRENGFAPFLVAATAGTTNSGAIDSLNEIADICAAERLWFHTDAAWGGAAALAPEWSDVLAGIERTDSITIDAHKWLSVPMGAGLFLTRHRDILNRTFHISTAYMPSAPGLDVIDPYTHSMQWSRRFIGLKLFLSLAVAGWDGYAAAIRHQIAMGTLLRHELAASGWKVVNDTPLPVACFIDNDQQSQWSAALAEEISRRVVSSGRAWISVTRAQGDLPVLRACITNYRTGPEDVRALVDALNATRATCSSVA